MTAEDDLKLAWIAHREGRRGRRDVLLTLAVAEGALVGAEWAGPLSRWLIRTRPDHPFARLGSLNRALADRRVIQGIGRMRTTYPPAKVRLLLRRAEAARGPFTGKPLLTPLVLDDLLGSRPIPRKKTVPIAAPPTVQREPLLAYYMTVLVAIATLCAMVLRETDAQRAA